MPTKWVPIGNCFDKILKEMEAIQFGPNATVEQYENIVPKLADANAALLEFLRVNLPKEDDRNSHEYGCCFRAPEESLARECTCRSVKALLEVMRIFNR